MTTTEGLGHRGYHLGRAWRNWRSLQETVDVGTRSHTVRSRMRVRDSGVDHKELRINSWRIGNGQICACIAVKSKTASLMEHKT